MTIETGAAAPAAEPVKARFLLLVAVSLGAIAGVIELSLKLAAKILFHRTLFYGIDLLWMQVVADLVPVVLVGCLLLGVIMIRPSLLPIRRALGLLVVAATGTVLYYFVPKLHPLAVLILSSGLGVVLSQAMVKDLDRTRRVTGRLAGIVVGAVIALSAALHLSRAITERRAMARLPARPAGSPNVLLIVMDAVRAPSLSLYGYARPTTPVLTRLAATSTVFDFAVSTASWTLPSHGSLFTGRWAHETGADWTRPLDPSLPTLAESLAAQGYATGGFVANWWYVGREFGLNRGFMRFEDYPTGLVPTLVSSSLQQAVASWLLRGVLQDLDPTTGRKTAPAINAAFLDWQQRIGGKPFFAFLNYFEAHEPYQPCEPFASRFGVPSRRRLRRVTMLDTSRPERIPPSVVADAQLAYDASIATEDDAIGQLLGALDARGVLANTLLIITSDHGEEFGEHGLFRHGYSLYLPVTHVPLLLRWPGHLPQGVRALPAVSLRDIPATVVSLLAVRGGFPGRSLERFLGREAAADRLISAVDYTPRSKPWFPVSKGDLRAALDGRFHLIRDGDGRLELYDLRSDPQERTDLANDSAHAQTRRSLFAYLQSAGAVPSLRAVAR